MKNTVTKNQCCACLLSISLFLAGCGSGSAGGSGHSASSDKLIARTYNSGFDLAHDTYNGMSVAGDGRIYYVLSSESYEIGAQMYCYDPATDKIKHLGDLTEACGEKGAKTIGLSGFSGGKLAKIADIPFVALINDMQKVEDVHMIVVHMLMQYLCKALQTQKTC